MQYPTLFYLRRNLTVAYFATILTLFVLIMTPSNLQAQDTEVTLSKKVIFEIDMSTDVDDVGALATLHALADSGAAEILAISFNEVHPSAANAICAINTWYNRGDIPTRILHRILKRLPNYWRNWKLLKRGRLSL